MECLKGLQIIDALLHPMNIYMSNFLLQGLGFGIAENIQKESSIATVRQQMGHKTFHILMKRQKIHINLVHFRKQTKDFLHP